MMFKIIRVILFFVAFASTASYAEVASPLGLELGKATIEDVKAKYKIIEEVRDNEFSCTYKLATEGLPLKNVSEAMVAVNSSDIVQAVSFDTDKSKFESFSLSLSEKYKVLNKSIPFVGNKKVEFQADNCIIILDAPHMDFNLHIYYLTQEYYDLVIKAITQEERDKKQAQDNAL